MRYHILIAAVIAAFASGLSVWALTSELGSTKAAAEMAPPSAAGACRLHAPDKAADLTVISLGREAVGPR